MSEKEIEDIKVLRSSSYTCGVQALNNFNVRFTVTGNARILVNIYNFIFNIQQLIHSYLQQHSYF